MTASAAVVEKPKPRLRVFRELGLMALLVVIVTGFSLASPPFRDVENLRILVRDQAPLAVLAVGMTLVILTGGIDLSVGSIVALSGVVMGLVWKATGSGPLALIAVLGTGALCGLLNGLLIALGRVPPLIVTLATLSVFRGGAFALGGSNSLGGFPPLIRSWSHDDLAGLPVPLWITVAVFVGVGIYLSRTDGGRAIYAVGSNAEASGLSGVPVNLLKLRLYAASGLLAGFAALLYGARNDSVRADIGSDYELTAITIVVLGGTSVAGGSGSMLGSALGYLTLAFLQNGLRQVQYSLPPLVIAGQQFRLTQEHHGIIVAFLLIGALLLDSGFRRKSLAAAK